ncbi:MAG: LAGLIDADG family homing endonuclease [Candidatus Diapherotrites archaeon]
MAETQAVIAEEKRVLDYVEKKNALAEAKAVKLLMNAKEFEKIVDELLGEGVFILTEEKVREKILKKETKLGAIEEEVLVKRKSFRALAEESAPQLRILSELDVTNQMGSRGTVKNFLQLFQDKFEFLSSVLRQRINFNPKPISRLNRVMKNSEVDIIGMIRDKRMSKKGNPIVFLEDLEAECIAVFSKNDQRVFDLAKTVVLDDVIGVKGKKISDEMIVVNDIFFPDLPMKPIKKVESTLNLAVISDMHVGSKLFLEKEFGKFISWLNGNVGSEKEIERIGRIKYLVVAGDNVDGVGIYPDQFDELAVKDIFEQYNIFSELIKQVPEYIKVIICTPKGTLLKTAEGYKPVEELKEGDQVFSFDEKQGRVVTNKIRNKISRFAKKLIKLTFTGGVELICTPEHPLLVYENKMLVWKNASELTAGSLLPVPRAHNEQMQINTLDLLNKINGEIYIKKPETILLSCYQKKSLNHIPERTRSSYFSGEAPMPWSLLAKTNSNEEKSFDWPIKVKTHHGNYVKLPKIIPPEFLYALGILLTDGSFSKIKNKFPDGRCGFSYRVRIFNSNQEIINAVKSCLKEFDIDPTEEYIEFPKTRSIAGRAVSFRKPIFNLSYTNRFLGELLIALGINPGPKKKSSLGALATLPWEHIKYVLGGLFDGDGTRSKKMTTLTTSSKRFATEVFLLLQEHGFAPNLRLSNKINTVCIHRNPDIKRFFGEVPLKRISRDVPSMNDNISKGRLNNAYPVDLPLKDFVLWRKLVKSEEIAGETVYNLEVENAHTYIAMGFINHNCPGQHDAVRRADPQPAVPKEFVKDLYSLKNVHFVGSPSWVEIEGLKTLIYHGASLHDLYASLNSLSSREPHKAIIEILKRRSLMPTYGLRQPYVPEKKDFLLIREEPDLYIGGDMHHTGFAQYKACTVINSSTWQKQTNFQLEQGHVPTPGIALELDLQTRSMRENYFIEQEKE